MPTRPLAICATDLASPGHASAFIDLLDHYARDPMGGGEGLSAYARANLCEQLRALPIFHGALAFQGEKAVGLINCFSGFSTFAAQPLLNIHDVVVHADVRRQGIAQALLLWAEAKARHLGCCKLTLEILANNMPAMRSYQRAGFAPYALDPAAGDALLMQKFLEEV